MAKKRITNDDVHDRYTDENVEMPFSGEYSDDVFAALDADEVQDSTLPIMSIIPDATQPRRIVPLEFRQVWDGKSENFYQVIETWEQEVYDLVDDYPVQDILNGKTDPPASDERIVLAFNTMLRFAGNILDVGLQQAIKVVRRGDVHRIVYGERRWTAFQFLYHYTRDERWLKIPAEVSTQSEWELANIQAAENFHDESLNAIETTRQVAKLIMLACDNDTGTRYDSFQAAVVACDRPFFAQVRDGTKHRIPDHLADEIAQNLNMSKPMLRRYRALLALTDVYEIDNALWDLADFGDWTENFLREMKQHLDNDVIREVLNAVDGWSVTAVTLSQAEDAFREAITAAKKAKELAAKQAERDAALKVDKSKWPSYQWVGKEVYQGTRKVFVEDMQSEYLVTVIYDDDKRGSVHIATLRDEPPHVDKSGWPSMQWVGTVADAGGVKVKVATALSPNTVRVYDDKDKAHEISIEGLVPWGDSNERDTDKTDTPQASSSRARDKHGIPIIEGQTVKTRMGHIGKVAAIKGTLVNVDVPGNPYLGRAQYGDTLEVVNPETGDLPASAKPADDNPYDEPIEDILDLDTWEETGSENMTSPEVDDAVPTAVNTIMDHDGERVFVLTKGDLPGMVYVKRQRDGRNYEVFLDELTPVDPSSPVADALTPPTCDGDELPAGEEDKLVFLNTDNIRVILSSYQQQAIIFQDFLSPEDQKAATVLERKIQAVLTAKLDDYNRDEFEALLHETYAGMENLCGAILAQTGEYFQMVVKEYGEGR